MPRFPHGNDVYSAIISPDGIRILTIAKYLSASQDTTAHLWDSATGKELAQLSHEDLVSSATFSPDGSKVVTASGRITRVWETSAKELAQFSHGAPVDSATLSPDGTKVLTSDYDKTARVWNVATGKELARFSHKGLVKSATFSLDGSKVVTASNDKTARIWTVATSKELAQFSHKNPVWSATFSAGGTKILTFSSDEIGFSGWYIAAQVWDVAWLTQHQGQDLIERTCHKKLIGASHLKRQDLEISPLLSGCEGEDVCDPPSWFSRLAKGLGFGL